MNVSYTAGHDKNIFFCYVYQTMEVRFRSPNETVSLQVMLFQLLMLIDLNCTWLSFHQNCTQNLSLRLSLTLLGFDDIYRWTGSQKIRETDRQGNETVYEYP